MTCFLLFSLLNFYKNNLNIRHPFQIQASWYVPHISANPCKHGKCALNDDKDDSIYHYPYKNENKLLYRYKTEILVLFRCQSSSVMTITNVLPIKYKYE